MRFYFKEGRASVEFDANPGPLTFARLGLWDEKPFMVIIAGSVENLDAETREKLSAQTDPTQPDIHAKLNSNFDEFIKRFPCGHILAVDGDYVDALVNFCEIIGQRIGFRKSGKSKIIAIRNFLLFYLIKNIILIAI